MDSRASWFTSLDFSRPSAFGDLAHELETRLAQQAAVARVAKHALEGASLESLLEEIIFVVREQLRADIVGFIQTADDPGQVVLMAGVGWPEHLADRGQLVDIVEGGVTERVLKTRSTLIIDDVANSIPSPMLHEAGIRSSVLVPIHGDQRSGLIGAHSITPRTFSESDGTFLAAAASVVAVAQARLEAEAAVHHRALHDSLTGLPNRVLFFDRLEHALSRGRRSGGKAALLLLDLDRFKVVNDTLGHAVGDTLLKNVSARIRNCVRASDTLARLGGDEFAVVLDEVVDEEQAEIVARKIIAGLSEPVACGGLEIPVDVSIGIVYTDNCDVDSKELLRRADLAMYRAKYLRKGVSTHDPELATPTLRLDLVSAARTAIAQQEFRLVYQPKIRIETGEIVGAEALLRWDHPELGLLMPSEFLPPLEPTSSILSLSSWVVSESIGQCARWYHAGLHVPTAFNASPSYLQSPGLVRDVTDALARHDLPASMVTIEVTEHAIFTDPETAMAAIDKLASLGVRLSLDDFGTGYSSLGHLDILPVNELKIDRSFVSGLGDPDADDRSRRRSSIVRRLAQLGADLGIDVVAEGVEHPATLAALRAIGCPTAQGFIFGEGIDPATLELWLSDRRAPAEARFDAVGADRRSG